MRLEPRAHFEYASICTKSGQARYCPVIGVPQKRGSSRTRMARPAARVAPAEHPPRMIPFSLGDIARDSALAMAYRCGLIQRGLVGTLPEEVENHPFQGRKTVVQLDREQMAWCEAIHSMLSSQKKWKHSNIWKQTDSRRSASSLEAQWKGFA